MTRQKCESAIAKKLREIWDIYQTYYPGGVDLSLIVTDHSTIIFNGDSLCGGEKALDYYERLEEVGEDATN